MRYLIVDGMLSGTGIRDAVEGGYVDLEQLGISRSLQSDINVWVARYESSHYAQFNDSEEVDALDNEGVSLCKRLRSELSDSKIEYFSNARMQNIRVS